MRKAKDNGSVCNRYYRPTITTCPHCGALLRRRWTLWDKYLVTLEGQVHIFSVGFGCSRSGCSTTIYYSDEAERLSPKGYSFGYDVMVQIGWWRFWDHRTLDEIAQLLAERKVPMAPQRATFSRRHILYLIGDFLALLKAAQPAKIKLQEAYFKRHGLVISLDGMEPEKGNEMLFVVREANLDLTLMAETLYSSRADLISRHLLEPLKELGYRIRAVISDADKNISGPSRGQRRAVESSLPGCPHGPAAGHFQACQVHCLCDAGQPIFEMDRAMKTDLRREIRAKLRPMAPRRAMALN